MVMEMSISLKGSNILIRYRYNCININTYYYENSCIN